MITLAQLRTQEIKRQELFDARVPFEVYNAHNDITRALIAQFVEENMGKELVYLNEMKTVCFARLVGVGPGGLGFDYDDRYTVGIGHVMISRVIDVR